LGVVYLEATLISTVHLCSFVLGFGGTSRVSNTLLVSNIDHKNGDEQIENDKGQGPWEYSPSDLP
jgi:hypothetical protein